MKSLFHHLLDTFVLYGVNSKLLSNYIVIEIIPICKEEGIINKVGSKIDVNLEGITPDWSIIINKVKNLSYSTNIVNY